MSTKYSSIEELRKEITSETLRIYREGCNVFPQVEQELEISFGLVGRVAGKAHTLHVPGKHWIEYNMGLAWENPEFFLNDTVPHEITHLIANMFFNLIRPTGCGHDELWQFVVLKMGYTPHQFHNMIITDTSKEISRNARKVAPEEI